MNIERILEENVLLNFNINFNQRDIWDKDNSLINDTFTVVIPLRNIDKDVSLGEIYTAFRVSNNDISIDNNEIKIKVFTGEFVFLNSMKDIYEEVETTVKYVSNILERLKIKDFKLIYDFRHIYVNLGPIY